MVAVAVKPRPRRRVRRFAGYRRPVQRRQAISPDRAAPPTWRAWKARTGRRWWRYPLAVEWGLEWLYYRLRSLALFDLLELAGRTTVLVIAILWVLEADDRAKERHYRAWELINSARGSTGDGGRRDAVQDLNNDDVRLATAPLENAYLEMVDLTGANLQDANLQDTNLNRANLERANLDGANLKGAKLIGANLQRANLEGANLQHADLRANLRDANLEDANLQHADLRANLRDANLQHADLRGANLDGANLKGAFLHSANLTGARNLTQEQLNATNGNDWTQLPTGFTRPADWEKAKAPATPPAPQPDAAGTTPAAPGEPTADK